VATARRGRRAAGLGALALAVAAVVTAGCERPAFDFPPTPRTVEVPDEGETLLQAMYQIERASADVELNLQNPAGLADVRQAAREILTWIEAPVFSGYAQHPDFEAPTPRFEELRAELRQSVTEVLEGAEAEDLEQVRDGYIGMHRSCIACHKRFDPNH